MTSTSQNQPPDRPALADVVHRNIQAEMAFAGMKRADLQRALDVAPMYLQRRYTMGTEWSWSDIERIADWLNIPETKLTNRPA